MPAGRETQEISRNTATGPLGTQLNRDPRFVVFLEHLLGNYFLQYAPVQSTPFMGASIPCFALKSSTAFLHPGKA